MGGKEESFSLTVEGAQCWTRQAEARWSGLPACPPVLVDTLLMLRLPETVSGGAVAEEPSVHWSFLGFQTVRLPPSTALGVLHASPAVEADG